MARLFAILAIVFLWVSPVYAETPQLFVKERLGTTKSAVVIPNEMIQVELVIENRGPDFSGTVTWASDATNFDHANIQSLSVRSGEKKTIRFTALFSDRNGMSDTITRPNHLTFTTTDGKKIPYKNSLSSVPRVNQRSYIYFGLLSNMPERLTYFNQLGKIGDSSGSLADEVSLEYLRDSRFSLHPFDYIVIDDYDLAKLDEKQRKHLLYYIQTGGTVLLGYNRYDAAQLPLFATMLDFSNDTVPATTTVMPIKQQAKAKQSLKGNLLSPDRSLPVTVQQFGLGRVVQYPFAFSRPEIGAKVENYTFITQTIQRMLEMGIERPRINSGIEYQVVDPMQQVERTMFNPRNFIIGIMIYVLAISFGVYLVLKRMNRLSYAWFVIPIGSVVTTLLLFGIGASDRLKGMKVQNAQVLMLGQKDAYGYGSVSLFNDREGNIEMKQKNQFFWPYRSNAFDGVATEYPYVTETTNEQQKVTFNDVSLWSVVQAAGIKVEEEAGVLASDLTFKGERLVGTIRNDTKWNFTELYFLNGSAAIRLPAVKRGETINVNVKNRDKTTFYPQAPIGSSMANLRYGYSAQTPLKEKTAAEIERWKRDRLLDGAYSSVAMNSVFGRATTPIMMGLSKDGYKMATYDHRIGEENSYTVAFQAQQVKGKAEGPYRVRLVLGTVTPLSGAIRYLYPSEGFTAFEADLGEYEVTYDIPAFFANTKVKSLIVTVPKTNKRTFSIYNFKTGTYEPLSNAIVFRLKQASSYTVNNQFKVKVKVVNDDNNDSRMTRVPALTIEGDVR